MDPHQTRTLLRASRSHLTALLLESQFQSSLFTRMELVRRYIVENLKPSGIFQKWSPRKVVEITWLTEPSWRSMTWRRVSSEVETTRSTSARQRTSTDTCGRTSISICSVENFFNSNKNSINLFVIQILLDKSLIGPSTSKPKGKGSKCVGRKIPGCSVGGSYKPLDDGRGKSANNWCNFALTTRA